MRTLVSLSLVVAFAAPAVAGAPAVCWPIEIGDAESLPMAEVVEGPFGVDPDYDTSALVSDTLALLTPEMPIHVRMETMRRAGLYTHQRKPGQRALALELLTALQTRALESDSRGEPDALAWFDVGYLSACYGQLERGLEGESGQGYRWIVHAISLGLDGPAVQLAAAIASFGGENQTHVHAAAKSCQAGSPVDSFLRVYFPRAFEAAE